MIPVGTDRQALVSIQDYGYLAKFNWTFANGYARRQWRDKGVINYEYMHHAVFSRAFKVDLDNHDVDHKNRVRLDNRRKNLRVSQRWQNSVNRVCQNKNGRRGVFRSTNKFYVRIRADSVQITVGSFEDLDTAAWMYDQWAIALHEDFAVLNFDYK